MSIDKHHPDYVDLKKRLKECPKEFVVISGAGLSRSAGLPTWNLLREDLIANAKSRLSEIHPDQREARLAKLNDLRQSRRLIW